MISLRAAIIVKQFIYQPNFLWCGKLDVYNIISCKVFHILFMCLIYKCMHICTSLVTISQSKDLCRDLIKRAKAWRNHTWPRGSGGTGRPSSYLVSLLVAKAFENSQKKMGLFSTMNPDTLALKWVALVVAAYAHAHRYLYQYSESWHCTHLVSIQSYMMLYMKYISEMC